MNDRFSRPTAWRFAWIILACLGCTPQRAGPSPAPVISGPANNTPITLTPVDRAGYDAAIARLHGKVVLVDYWATWCQPCVEKLPHTLDLGQRLAARGLAVVTVSCDDPAESTRVAEFLSTQHANGATNLISEFGGSPRTMDEFEIENGSVPFYKLYDRKGQLRQTFGVDPAAKKQFTSADIEAAVDKLLAEKG